jgi:pimeloyl-ACP methyl ester carboxylesterase
MREYALKSGVGSIRYHDMPGEGDAILFIHGLGCSGSSDYPEVAVQSGLLKYRRIIVDLLGFGFSDKPQGFDYSARSHAKCLLELAEGLGLERLSLYGHSMGGAVALSLASLCVSKVYRIILSEANLDSGGGITSRAIAGQDMDHFIKEGFYEMAEASADPIWGASLLQSSPYAAYLFSKSAVEGENPSWREILYGLSCPRTFLFGEKSLPDPYEATLQEKGVSVDIVIGVGHSMASENPKSLAAAIGRAMDRV